MSNQVSEILKKLNTKIDELSVDKKTAEELKKEIEKLSTLTEDSDLNEQIEQLTTKLDSLESHNMSLKDSVYDFVTSTTKTLETLTKNSEGTSSEDAEKLNEFLKNIDKKIDKIIKNKPQDITGFAYDEDQFKKLKEEITFFQNEIETRINENFSGIEETVTTVISEIRNKMSDLQETFEQNSEKLLTEIISDVKQLKADISDVSDSVRNIDNQSIFNTEKNIGKVIDLTKKNNTDVMNELEELKTITAKSAILDAKSKEAIDTFKNELAQLKANIHTQIREVLSKIVIQDEIKFLCEEAITGIKNNNSETGVVRKYLKDLRAGDDNQVEILNEIKTILTELSEYELNDNSDKIDIIYENLSMLNTWANSSDKIIENFDNVNNRFENVTEHFDEVNEHFDKVKEDFEDLKENIGKLNEDIDINSDKLDIIYENLTFVNEWVKQLDKFAQDIEAIKIGYESEEKLSDKIDEIKENITLIKEWNKKSDALALQIRALSVQISETESTVNSQNLADMKKLFVQLSDDMSNLSSRTNKMILETDKTNDTMKGHIVNLQNIINSLDEKTNNFGIDELNNKIDDIKQISSKSTGFEQGLTESFIYLAEWIDFAGNTINEIKNEVNNLKLQQIEQQQDQKSINNNFIQIEDIVKQQNEQSIRQIQYFNEQNNITIQKIYENQNLQIQQLKEQNEFATQQLIANQATIQQLLKEIKTEQEDNKNEQADNVTDEILQNIKNLSNLIEKNEDNNQSKITEMIEDTNAFIQSKTDNSEIKNLLDFIATQVVNMNENDTQNEIFEKRLDAIENKISNLEQYMAKLIDYLDED